MHGFQPLYRQVEKQILECLERGEWKPGDRLPTECQLAERFGVAVFTIRAGIGELVAANILLRRQGKGTFVARHGRARQRYQCTRIFRNDGGEIWPERQLVSFARTTADRQTAELLHLSSNEKPSMLRIECVIKSGTRAVATLDVTVPTRLFAGLSARVIRDNEETLYAIYQEICGINVIRIEEQVYAVKAGTHIAKVLGIPARQAVLQIDRIAYTYNNVPVEFRRRIHQASDHHYHTEIGA